MKRKEFDCVWVFIGTDNYEIIKQKFLNKKLSLTDAFELERLSRVGYFDDELNAELNKLHREMEVVKSEENYKSLAELMEKELSCLEKKVEVAPNYILKSVTPRQFGRQMIYLMLYAVDPPGLYFTIKENN